MDSKGSTDKTLARTSAGRRSRRLRRGGMLLLALGLVAATGASAHARDVCMDYSGGGNLVLKGLRVPPKNKCVAMQGFENLALGGTMSGMACTNAQGDGMMLHYTSHDHRVTTSYFESGTCRIRLPIQPGGNGSLCSGTYVVTPGGNGRFDQFAHFYYCDRNVPY
jgi:hypothetical protein